jgi:hypothetical protein
VQARKLVQAKLSNVAAIQNKTNSEAIQNAIQNRTTMNNTVRASQSKLIN